MANCIRCGRQLPGFTFGKKICQWCVQHEAEQRGELADDARQPVMRTPWVGRNTSTVGLTQIFFGINVAVFLGMVLASGSPLQDFSGPELVQWGANAGALTLSGEWWRLLTCVFIHGNLLHIAFNMWCLWDLGALSESLYGRWAFGAIYVLCGLGASLASVTWNVHVLSVGASGAIFGLAGALIAAFKLGEFSVPRAALSGTLRSLVVFVGFNLIFGAASGVTDNAAHVGGLITGLILGALIALLAPLQEHAPRRLAIFVVMILALAGGADALAHHYGMPLRLRRANYSNAIGQVEGNPAQLIARLQKMVKQQPTYAPGHIALAKVYFGERQFAAAEKELQRALELDPKNVEAELELGNVYLNQNRPQDAKNVFAAVIAQDGNNADAHFGMGLALAAAQNDQAAIEEYQTAIRLDPESGGVNYNLGLSYFKLRKYDEALAAYLKEQQQSGDTEQLETSLAEAYQAKGLTQEAEEAKRKAVKLKIGGGD
jgi:membrane associated rhomboid family serine protease/Tfp pilus assembly protein PilF